MDEAILDEIDVSTTTPKVVATGMKHEFDCKYSDAVYNYSCTAGEWVPFYTDQRCPIRLMLQSLYFTLNSPQTVIIQLLLSSKSGKRFQAIVVFKCSTVAHRSVLHACSILNNTRMLHVKTVSGDFAIHSTPVRMVCELLTCLSPNLRRLTMLSLPRLELPNKLGQLPVR